MCRMATIARRSEAIGCCVAISWMRLLLDLEALAVDQRDPRSITRRASSMSRRTQASIDALDRLLDHAAQDQDLVLQVLQVSLKPGAACRRSCWPSAEPPGDVVLGAPVLRVGEDRSVGPYSTSSPMRSSPASKNAVKSRHARRLLHVVRHDRRSCSAPSAARSAPRSCTSRSGRAPSTARPSAAPPAPRRARARCTAAAAGRPRATRPTAAACP